MRSAAARCRVAGLAPRPRHGPAQKARFFKEARPESELAPGLTKAIHATFTGIDPIMKHLPTIVGGLLGLLFIASGVVVLFKLTPMPPPPEGTPAGHFMAAFVPTGYLTFVKAMEVLGGLLVAVPRTRNLGLLVLGPIIVNILAFHGFVMKGEGLFAPPILMIAAMALYLLWCGRREFGGLLVRRNTGAQPETQP